jgi:cytochrome o ubiquinol oxidase subunit III
MSQMLNAPIDQSAETINGNLARVKLGFWVYLMTDCVLFASLFAAYAVLHNNVFGGPDGKELFSLPFVLTETLLLLTSSFTCGLAIVGSLQRKQTWVLIGLAVTFMLGLAFLGMELTEFRHLVSEGHSWRTSGFLSSFFTLVGTHGLHITSGLLWILVTMWQIGRKSLTTGTQHRLTLLSLFWHFLDVIWIFIFTLVYLLGAL